MPRFDEELTRRGRNQRMPDEDRCAKVQGTVFAALSASRMKAAAAGIIRPLVKKARVPKKLKEALYNVTDAVTLDDFDIDLHNIVRKQLDDLARENIVTARALGGYALSADKPNLTVSETREYAKVLLRDWPEEARDEILRVFARKADDVSEQDEGEG